MVKSYYTTSANPLFVAVIMDPRWYRQLQITRREVGFLWSLTWIRNKYLFISYWVCRLKKKKPCKFDENYKPTYLKSSTNSKPMKYKKTIPENTIIKLFKTSVIERKNIKSRKKWGEKRHIIYRGTKRRRQQFFLSGRNVSKKTIRYLDL